MKCFRRPFIRHIGLVPVVLQLAACSDGVTPTEIGPSGVTFSAVPAAPPCGATITVSTVLTADLLACPDHGLIIGADNITLDGAGHTIEYGASGTDDKAGILLVGRSGVTIQNLELVDVNPAGSRVRGIWLQNTASNNQLLDNTIRTNGVSENDGIVFGPGTSFQSNVVRGNDITTSGTDNANNGIHLVGGDANLIDANTIRTQGTIGNHGIALQSSAGIVATNNIIQNNDITSGGSVSVNEGIGISGAATSGTQILDNTITTTGTANTSGITLVTSTHDNEIRGNTIVTQGPGVNHHGIQVLLFASDNRVVDNTITTNGLNGRGVVIGDATGNEFSGNTIVTGAGGGNGEGFMLDPDSYDNQIVDNQITTVVSPGIRLTGGSGAIITGNTIHGTNASPILMSQGASAAEISGNTLRWTGSGIGLVLRDGATPVKLFHNNFGAADGLPSNPASKVDSDTPIELSYNGQGNFWGRSCPDPLFVAGVDSNAPDVMDSYPYAAFDGWLTGAMPGCDSEGPVTASTTAVPNPVAVVSNVDLAAVVDDSNTGESTIASAEYSLDGGATWSPMSATNGAFDEVSEDVEATFSAPAGAGIHDLCVRGADAAGNVGDPECIMLVVYDPSAGFVTGGGWIDSPPGALVEDPMATGKATFGFVSRYQKGAATPTGNAAFRFHAAGFNFQSSSYDWLVVNQGGTNAQFKGTGTVNGGLAPNGSEFRFMIWAKDDSPDTFRIRVWWESVGGVETDVYDNGFNQQIGGGQITVHAN